MITDPLARARELLSKPVCRFDHATPGSKVVGLVVELATGEGNFGEYPIVSLDDGERIVTIACHRSVLRREIMGRDIRLGDALGVEYTGEQHTRGGQAYFGYRVVHVPADPADELPPRIPGADELDGIDEFSDEPF